MKKILLGTLIAATTALTSGIAAADIVISPSEFKPYVGLDYTYLNGFDGVALDDFDGLKPLDGHINTLGVTFGLQLTDYIGIETSYNKGTDKLSGANLYSETDGEYSYESTTGKVSFDHITLGVTGQYPIAEQVYVKGLIGASWQRYDANGINHTSTYTPATAIEDGSIGTGSTTEPRLLNDGYTETHTTDLRITSKNDAAFLAKVGVGYQASKNSVFEANYTRAGDLDGFGLQYKYVF